ncbi:MAG: glycosyltransferase family 2 protein [Alphaproteobacteria bacterium]|nr:glycosyltransferase family 2 protein [Alphaproteobacteria bacterium]
MSDSLPELSIVMPCLNEARTLPLCLYKARAFLEENGIEGEIVVADNGSEDGSARLAEGFGARVVHVAEKGYGAALAGGISACRGRYVIMGDADDSYDFSDLMPFVQKLREGVQLVVGNRFKGGIKKGAMPFLNRYLGNPVLSFIGRLFFRIPLGDFHCGLRGFSREAVLSLGLRTVGMEYASEMIVRASLMGLRMEEVSVTLSPDGRDRSPHLHPWRDGWRHLRFLLLYSPRWLFLYPGLAMIVVGVLMSLLLLPGPVMIADDVGLDVHTLLVGAMSILVGMQSLTFGVLARSFAKRNGMLPRCSPFDKFLTELRLEHFLLAALVLLALGVGTVGWAMHRWSAVHFGALDYRDVMRILIVAVTCIVGGLQLGFSAFLLGVMQIRHK